MSAPPSPSGEPRARSARWVLAAVVILPLAARLAAAGQIHLTEDEAYYRLWSFAPALGYYDHPPMIAWWIAAGRLIAGDNPLGVRLLPILASAVTSFVVFDLARLAGAGEAAAARSAVFFAAALLVAAGAILAVPDAPASLFWAASLWCVLKARRGRRTAWWLGAGVAAGLACLSKYSALFLGPGVLAWLISSREGRAELRSPGPWLAAALACALFGLNVLWNGQHHWPTFERQFGRVGAGAFSPAHLPRFLAGQFLLINPIIALFAVRLLARPRASPITVAPFVATSAPFALYLLVHSLHARVEAHWPAPLYPAIAILAAVGAEGAKGLWIRLRAAAPIVGFGLAAAAMAWLAVPANDLALPADPALPVRGWAPFAAAVEARREALGAAWIGTASYGLASELADEKALRAPVIEILDRARWRDLARAPAPDLARPGLIVDLPRRIAAAPLSLCFASVRPLGLARRGDAGGPFTTYQEVEVSGPRGDLIGQGCPR